MYFIDVYINISVPMSCILVTMVIVKQQCSCCSHLMSCLVMTVTLQDTWCIHSDHFDTGSLKQFMITITFQKARITVHFLLFIYGKKYKFLLNNCVIMEIRLALEYYGLSYLDLSMLSGKTSHSIINMTRFHQAKKTVRSHLAL